MLRFGYALLFLLLGVAPVGAESPTLVGTWLHANQRIRLEIAPCGDRLCGKLVWFKRPNDAQGRPLTDFENPDPALRTRPLLGLTVLRGLRRVGERTWEDGKIYNPDDGEDYNVTISIQDDATARVRAYVFLPVFGQTQTWTRVH